MPNAHLEAFLPHEEGAVCKGDQSSRVWAFNVSYNNVGVSDTWMVTTALAGWLWSWKSRDQETRERVRDRAKEAGAHCFF